MRFTFTVDGRPVAQGSHMVMRGRVMPVNGAALKKWRGTVSGRASAALPPGWSGAGAKAVDAVFLMQRPKAHYRSSGALKDGAPLLPVLRPDVDKLARAIGDSLTDAGVVDDDSQIVGWRLTKVYAQGWGAVITIMDIEGLPRAVRAL